MAAPIKYCGILFVTYEAQYWFFEIFEMFRKLALTALLIFVGDSSVRIATGFLISFFCLLVVMSTRPFVSPTLDVPMAVSLITQTLTLSCMSSFYFVVCEAFARNRQKHFFLVHGNICGRTFTSAKALAQHRCSHVKPLYRALACCNSRRVRRSASSNCL